MIPKCIVLLHSRQSHGAALIVFGDLSLTWTRVEGQIDTATQSPPGQTLGLRDDFQTMGISQKHAVGEGCVLFRRVRLRAFNWSEGTILLILVEVSSVQIKWIGAVEVPKYHISSIFPL